MKYILRAMVTPYGGALPETKRPMRIYCLPLATFLTSPTLDSK